MIGKERFSIFDLRFSIAGFLQTFSSSANRISKIRDRKSKIANRKLNRGFTLLELMIVISIIIILAVVALPRYERAIQRARETTLKDDLVQMRKMIDQYAADKGQLPQSLDDLVSAGYIREVPIDPITGERDWNVEMGEDPNLKQGGQGVRDVHSASGDQSSEGTPYNTW